MSDSESQSLMRCIACSGHLGPSGQEVYRMICTKCGQNYIVRLLIDPVAPLVREVPALLGPDRVE